MGVCSNGNAGSITAPSATRSRSCTVVVPRKSPNSWHFISAKATRRRKLSITRSRQGVKAGHGWANHDALSYFDEALRRLGSLPDIRTNRLRRIDTVLKQAEVKYALGQYTGQITALAEIHEIVDEADEPHRRATWHYWTGLLHSVSGGRPEVAIEHCREAAKIASASGLEEIDAFASSCLAQVYQVAGRLQDGLEAGERAVLSFETHGSPWWATLTLWHLTSIANYLGNWEASLDYCRRGLEHGIALNDVRLKAVSWTRMGVAHIVRGDIERGLHCCGEALALGPIQRDIAFATVVRGYAKIKGGCVNEGIAELKRGLDWFESSRMRWTYVIGAVWLAEGYLRGGDYLSACPLIEELLSMCRAAGYFHYEGRACWLMAECLTGEDSAAAEAYVERAMFLLERAGARNDLAKAMLTRAALRQRAGDIAAARRLLDEACAIFQALGTIDESARVEAALAALHRDERIPQLADAW